MKPFVCLLLIILCQYSFAQKNKRYTVKVYNLTTYQQSNKSYTINKTNIVSSGKKNDFTVLHPTIALNWNTKKSNFREVELTSFLMRSKYEHDFYQVGNVQAKTTEYNIELRYEYIINIYKNTHRKVLPQMGMSLSPYFIRSAILPYTLNSETSIETQTGLKHCFVPRCLFKLNKRMQIDVNIPILIAKINWQSIYHGNTSNSNIKNRYSIIDFDMLSKYYSARIGFCYQL